MGITLAIDTSSYVLGVAVLKDGQVAAELTTHMKKNHSLRLMPAVTDVLAELDLSPKDLSRIVVAVGPGSYTGVRIGVTTAKTLAWTLSVPLVGVSSLEVMAQQGRYFQGTVCPIIDARRNRVYTACYSSLEDGELALEGEEQLIERDQLLEHLAEKGQPVLFTGADIALHKDVIFEKLGALAHFAPPSKQLPRPSELAALGEEKQPVQDVHTLVPNYLQLSEAEAKWEEAQRGKANE
ncbi:tRNA (adenosine(37)-N6)-threonylcarbamoyltransferase complex dimerization subunit type 1 TsaB [Alkalicoccobacillus gibsonii]|uniref:tRNA (adenosine(37)-N6)-threonylcarbamoyltransferase complex dimerization subunit type 1 TsaB n=1 Tax=Alkalicoccobacillus gibsonii TaxID=79881 RepID=UPI0035115FBA